jgi:hypothetical protein
MSEGRSAYARAADDWYVEPPWVSERLLDAERFGGGAHDPACGAGAIPGVLESRGLPASGADIADRAGGKFARRPSIPPGALLQANCEGIRKGGSIDFAWYVWRVDKTRPGAEIGWLK